jgi:GxxExxY protein
MLYGSEDDNALTDRVIGCAIEVHRVLGPALLESVYEKALCRELQLNGIGFTVRPGYRSTTRESSFRSIAPTCSLTID